MEILSTIGQIFLWLGLIVVVLLVVNWYGNKENAKSGSLSAGNRNKAKKLLIGLPLREKEATIRELNTWSIGVYGGVTTINTEKALGIASLAFTDSRLFHLIQKEDNIVLDSRTGNSTRTIFRTGEDEFILHTYFDTGGN